jgi:drug/metabolite transporter (DMT)-like permease
MDTQTAVAGVGQSVNRAILCVVAGIFCLCVSDVFAKALMAHYSAIEVVFLRNIVAMPLVALILIATGRRAAFRSQHLGLHALRGLLSIGAAFCFFSSLLYLPLAEATSLAFAAPIFVTALSVPLLGEHVGWRRWAAVLVGFAGILIIVRPGAAAFQPASLFPVAAALFYALFMITARRIRGAESMWTVMFFITLFPLIYSAPLSTGAWQAYEPSHTPIIVGIALTGTVGVTLISLGFRLAPAAIVAPFDYTALVWASLFGWLFWSELPDAWTYAGSAIIIASGIAIILRENKVRAGG